MSKSLGSFYRGKRVLVTGHTGFKGGWLTEWLKFLGAQVTGFALPPTTRPNLFDAIALDRGMTSIFGDVRDRNALSTVFADHSPEILIHNAGQSSAAKSHREPVETYAVNVMGTVHILDEARYVRPLRAVVVATTTSAGERAWLAERSVPHEEKPDSAATPLASSRSCAESVTAAYRSSFFSELRSAALASVRSGELIGGGDWAEDRLIPELVRAIAGDEPLMIRRPDFIYPAGHVLESVRGCLMLAQRLYEEGQSHGDSWNLGGWEQDPLTVRGLAERVTREWGKGELIVDSGSQPVHGAEVQADWAPSPSTSLRPLPGWKPLLGLDQALQWSVEWYREYYRDPAAAWRMTQKQIGSYMDLIGSPERPVD
jgi:CDP-glucose 4,6-dehydratase